MCGSIWFIWDGDVLGGVFVEAEGFDIVVHGPFLEEAR